MEMHIKRVMQRRLAEMLKTGLEESKAASPQEQQLGACQ